MPSKLKALAYFSFAMLACCMLSLLVTDGEPPMPAPDIPTPPLAVLTVHCALPSDPAALPDAVPRDNQRALLPVCISAAPPVHLEAVCDGNGWLITGKTWFKTVYAVCPPEGVPG